MERLRFRTVVDGGVWEGKKIPAGQAVLVYVMPILVLTVLTLICLALYPDPALRLEFGNYLPLVMMFHLLGLLWVNLFRASDERSAFTFKRKMNRRWTQINIDEEDLVKNKRLTLQVSHPVATTL